VKTIDYGPLNEHAVGVILKDMMRRAMEEIWKRRVDFTAEEKIVDYKADPKDRVTDADFAAQEILLRKILECFPGYGIVAEEKGFARECTLPGACLFFTVDPLDGTKAFERRQSHDFGPMLSLSTPDEVVSSFVGDAMTKELYYYRPGSPKVHRLNFGDHRYERLAPDPGRPLSDQYVLLRDDPRDLPEIYCRIAQATKHGGIFKQIEVSGGGLGTGMARLWKGEVGAYVMKAGVQQPWDLLPVWGMSARLGFIWLTHDGGDGRWLARELRPSMKAVSFATPSIVIHRSRLHEFESVIGSWVL